ncbi:MAG: nitroreductase family protein, partial [Phycisphaerae bacterium]|nr:nitroreductase family protein [Phycisphaerae bacterium]
QITDAPAIVVFAGDRQVMQAHLEPMIQADLACGALDQAYARSCRANVRLAFGTGPLGLGWMWKALLAPLARVFRPVPEIPAVHRRAWLGRHVMLSAMLFMLAAADEGLATCPMEGFDEGRLRRVLGIPRRFTVPVIVTVGYAADENKPKSRLPLAPRLHRDRW